MMCCECVSGTNTDLATRVQTYWYMYPACATPAELATLSLVVRPISTARAACIWDSAKKVAREGGRPWEKVILEQMDVNEAAELLALERGSGRGSTSEGPLAVLAMALLMTRMRKHAAVLFVRAVLPDAGQTEEQEDQDQDEEKERAATIDAAKSLGGQIAETAESLEGAWKAGVCDAVLPVTDPADSQEEGEV